MDYEVISWPLDGSLRFVIRILITRWKEGYIFYLLDINCYVCLHGF